ncbi:dethiobiotin synthase [Plesiocystis pacifica SIR-1]|uniref:ATP-dependent dethiobiotin synthetase BioD n=1 Tax=Plesiocystis pacifica SIR-1 TaxID=391625 RepID=A6GJ24_9BACT|nr:dethiobiotin synthase [Plesiocystis pacifica]EDM74138.1 dethiobiotin synthase [Plesiocystis pacifica SIR-1]
MIEAGTSYSPSRIFVVGTDTDAGKTVVTCALLQAAARASVTAIPFKPAVSGPEGPRSDHARLMAASILDPSELDELAPMRWPTPVAPGLAEDEAPFLGEGVSRSDPESLIGRARWALARIEQRHGAQLSLIEGAGGLLVPMPGGTWLPEWITALRARPLIVARAGLGTINHTLLTIEALRARELEPVGFIFTQLLPRHDPSRGHNAEVIATRSGLPCLGRLPFLGRPPVYPDDSSWLQPEIWSRLLART